MMIEVYFFSEVKQYFIGFTLFHWQNNLYISYNRYLLIRHTFVPFHDKVNLSKKTCKWESTFKLINYVLIQTYKPVPISTLPISKVFYQCLFWLHPSHFLGLYFVLCYNLSVYWLIDAILAVYLNTNYNSFHSIVDLLY